jgi:hypothetical protein
MMVRCVKLLSPVDGSEQTESAWLTLDREYVVLSVLAAPGRDVKLQILNDEHSAGLFVSEMFLTTDASMPSNWIAKVSEGGLLELAPERWHKPGFWESYYDRDPEAVKIFDEDTSVIRSESGPASP